MVKIDFEFETECGLFRDALYLPEDHGLTNDEIEQLKLLRRDKWIALVTAPPTPDEVA